MRLSKLAFPLSLAVCITFGVSNQARAEEEMVVCAAVMPCDFEKGELLPEFNDPQSACFVHYLRACFKQAIRLCGEVAEDCAAAAPANGESPVCKQANAAKKKKKNQNKNPDADRVKIMPVGK